MVVTDESVPVPRQPVVKMVSSVGTRHGSHVGQGPHEYVAVGVAGQQSVEQGTVVLLTLMYSGQICVGSGATQWIWGHVAVFFPRKSQSLLWEVFFLVSLSLC